MEKAGHRVDGEQGKRIFLVVRERARERAPTRLENKIQAESFAS